MADERTSLLPDSKEEQLDGAVYGHSTGQQVRSRGWRSLWPLYVIILLFMFTVASGLVCVGDILFLKTCFIQYGNLSLCADPIFSLEHPELQGKAASWSSYTALIQLLPSIFSNLLLSSYCDKVGHKLPLVLPAIGSVLANAMLAVIVTPSYITLPVELMLLYGFLNSFLGYFPMIIMSAYSYISLSVTAEDRGIHLAICESCNFIGNIIGSAATGPITDAFGLNTTVYINLAISTIAAVIAVVFVKEIEKPSAITFKWTDMFKAKHVIEVFRTVYRKRPNRSRLLINVSFASYGSLYVLIVAPTILGFLYFVKEVGMTLTELSIYNGASTLLKAIACILLFYLAKRLKFRQLTCSLYTTAAVCLSFIMLSLGPQLSYIWLFAVLSSGFLVLFVAIRNLQVKLVPTDELGKLYAYDGLIEVILNTLVTLLFNQIYIWSLPFWPQFFAAILAAVSIGTLITTAALIFLILKHNPFVMV